MSAAHEPTIHYLDSILNEEEKRCDQYSHQWRNFTISRSGRFRSKNKKRDVVDGKLFDGSNSKENEKISARSATSSAISKTNSYATNNATMSGSATTATATTTTAATSSMRNQRDKMDSYKSFYETNL